MKSVLEQPDQAVGRLIGATPSVISPNPESCTELGTAAQVNDLCYRLGRLRRTREARSVLVTSTIPREGKTRVALNLAAALAQEWPRVLLIDGDLRKAGVATALGLSVLLPGLAESLEDHRDAGGAVRLVRPMNMYWLPAGCPSVSDPGRLMTESGLKTCLDRLSQQFDWVIVDSPSVQSADTRFLSDATDVIIMVVRTGFATKQHVRDSIRSLDGGFLAGVIFNEEERMHMDARRSFLPAVPAFPAALPS
jgi:protein-tyrosine kinase